MTGNAKKSQANARRGASVQKNRSLQELQEDIKDSILENERKELRKPDGPVCDDESGFLNIIRKEEEQSRDRIIWKAYSKHGGLYDILTDIENIIEHPSANAFSFDEEEGHFIIFIAFYNTHIKRMESLYDEMCDGYRSAHESGRQGLCREMGELQKLYDGLQKQYDNLVDEPNQFRKQYNEIQKRHSRVPPLDLLQAISRGPKEKKEEELKSLGNQLKSRLMQKEQYNSKVEAYNRRFKEFREKCDFQKAYTPKYTLLYEMLKQLCEVQNDDNVFHALTISPAQEGELEGYMEMARAYCRQISHIKNSYPL
ncbi:hypothetical protein LK537_06425 [Lachnoclostridium pacaense]|uniref:hypothetical protein n=1 Tax=Enterocloster hominis (ex Hitch et al. 2024) TaxID=1917870 RepID=UPI001D0FC072|nr:hypothetical protein [Lachnoclostridium pacaense]MCC2816928.1 hypothetical protein [Lachnoclostridium pacaense]